MPKSKKSKINNGKGGLKKMKNASKTKAQNNDEAEVQEVRAIESSLSAFGPKGCMMLNHLLTHTKC